MIYITGDCHAQISKLSPVMFPHSHKMTKNDYVIILGDFGLCWNHGAESEIETKKLDKLESYNFTTLFIDGNHENFDRLNAYPVEEWHGGKVQKLRPSVIHLMRGEIYDIEGLTFLAFGGAPCHDVEDGILDPKMLNFKEIAAELYEQKARFRVLGYSWWPQEVPNEEEWLNAKQNLLKHNNKVDFILTHEAPSMLLPLLLPGEENPSDMSRRLYDEFVPLDFKQWYFGHYHMNKFIYPNYECLYHAVKRIS